MSKTKVAVFVNDTIQGHAPQFEKADFLAIHSCHTMFRVGQTNEGNAFVFPILLKG